MAIVVTKRGTPPSEIIYETTCSNCHSTFEYKESDATIVSEPRDGSYMKFDCPVCKSIVLGSYARKAKKSPTSYRPSSSQFEDSDCQR